MEGGGVRVSGATPCAHRSQGSVRTQQCLPTHQEQSTARAPPPPPSHHALCARTHAHTPMARRAEFGSLLVWYFICDRTPVFESSEKSYSRDTLAFIFLALTAAAFGSSV